MFTSNFVLLHVGGTIITAYWAGYNHNLHPYTAHAYTCTHTNHSVIRFVCPARGAVLNLVQCGASGEVRLAVNGVLPTLVWPRE